MLKPRTRLVEGIFNNEAASSDFMGIYNSLTTCES